MGYKIVYDLMGEAMVIPNRKKWQKCLVWISSVVLVIMLLFWIWGGDLQLTATALEDMAKNLGNGSSIQEAFSEFCIDILSGAECG